jgi:hypothetical protein
MYHYIVHGATELYRLQLGNLLHLEGSLLSVVPNSVRYLQAHMLRPEDDPLDSLLEQMERLSELVEVPDLTFICWEDEEPDLEPVTADIIKHFEAKLGGSFSDTVISCELV